MFLRWKKERDEAIRTAEEYRRKMEDAESRAKKAEEQNQRQELTHAEFRAQYADKMEREKSAADCISLIEHAIIQFKGTT